MTSDPVPPDQSENERHSIVNIPDGSNRKSKLSIEIIMADMSYRLRTRKAMHIRIALVSDIMCFLAILGIVLMIAENELTFDRVDNSDTKASWSIKLVITISTFILLCLIIYYHYLDLKLYANQNSLQDFRVGLTIKKLSLILIELLICAIHPMPRSYPQSNPAKLDTTLAVDPYSFSYTAIDVALGLPMFFRLYLLGRTIMFHSRLVRDTSLRSLGYLNQVPINFFFLFKTHIEQWPGRCLLVLCTITFFIGSWALRASSYKPTREHISMSDSMWLYTITFVTVGYGDITPSTYCARAVAAIVSLVGLLISALIINVLAQKLQLSRAQKYIHTFVLNTTLANKRKHEAANVVKYSMKMWFLKRKDKWKFPHCMRSQQNLFQSIARLQEIKRQEKRLIDTCVGLHELVTIQRNMNVQQDETVQQINEMVNGRKIIEDKLNNITLNMENLQGSLNILLNHIQKQEYI